MNALHFFLNNIFQKEEACPTEKLKPFAIEFIFNMLKSLPKVLLVRMPRKPVMGL